VSGTGFAQTNNCLGTLAAGSTCTVNVTFIPSAAGTMNGTLNFTDNSGNLGSSQSLTLTGTGVGPFALSPNGLVFNSQAVGTTSAPQAVTATNQAKVSVTISNIAISGAGFTISSNTCGASLSVGASCTVGGAHTRLLVK
jgi:hypothetical protein